MSNFICADTEDDSRELMLAGKSGFDKKVTQIAAITAEGAHYYNQGNGVDFLDWFKKRPERFCYFHNLQYDLGNLFGDSLDALDVTLVGGRMIKAGWGKKMFVDSFNMWPMAVKKIGPAFGLEKLETQNMSEDKEYVFRDVEIIRAAMLFAWGFCEKMGLSSCPATLGGLAVMLWRLGGENCHDSNELSRLAMFGGRVELFKGHNDCRPVCYTDVNSLYPHVMCQDFPIMLEDWGADLPSYGVASVKVKQSKTDLPVLPWRRKDGRILYPWGTFCGTWTLAELRHAEQHGAKIERVFSCMGTNDKSTPYRDFMLRLYDLRKKSKSDAEKLFYKLLMNNLSGRLGNSGVIGRSVWLTEKNQYEGVPYGQKTIVELNMPLDDFTNWSHNAYLTAYGRIALHGYLERIGTDKMVYCDTDSCIFDCPGKKIPFPVGDELGQMKLVSWESIAQVWLPKVYRYGNEWKAKGVKKEKAKEFIQNKVTEFDLPFKFREAVRFYDRDNARKLSVWRKVEKRMMASYDRKNFADNRFFPCKVNQPNPV